MDTAGALRVTDHAAEGEACGAFRAGLYGCLTRRADALFELADTLVAGHALATAPPPHLSLEPAFRRGWGARTGRSGGDASPRRPCGNSSPPRVGLLAGRLRGRRIELGALRCRVQPERGYYHHRRATRTAADRGRLELQLDRPTQLGG